MLASCDYNSLLLPFSTLISSRREEPNVIIVPENLDAQNLEDCLEASVLQVFDGDGFLADVWNLLREAWVRRVPFRFAFIDAPEMAQPCGAQSQDFLQRLIAGKSLRLMPVGKESTGGMPIDPYKRMLCMAYLSAQIEVGPIDYYHDGAFGSGLVRHPRPVWRNIELEMIVNGWAWVLERYAFDREAEYLAAQDDARKARRGIWADECPEAPWAFKRRQTRLPNDRQLKLL